MGHKTKNKIVIVGGGFGGIKAALELARDKEFEVTLVSDSRIFVITPRSITPQLVA